MKPIGLTRVSNAVRALMLAAAFVLALGMILAPAFAQDLPRALTPKECGSIGDLVWSARALHKNGVESATARRVLVDMYTGVFEPAERARAYIDAAMRFATGALADKAPNPGVLGAYAHQTCHKHQGNLAPLFGTAL